MKAKDLKELVKTEKEGTSNEDAFEAGEKAAARGTPKDECPYSEPHPFHDDWISGFNSFRY